MAGGFNTNVRHHGRVFHVQTEQTRRPRPQVTTLLFEGGTILHSVRTELTGDVEVGPLEKRMQAQHQEFIGRLSEGDFDRQVGVKPGESPEGATPSPTALRGFGDGVITEVRLDELVLTQLASG